MTSDLNMKSVVSTWIKGIPMDNAVLQKGMGSHCKGCNVKEVT